MDSFWTKRYFDKTAVSAAFHSIPSGWFFQNQLALSLVFQELLTAVDPVTRRVFLNNVRNTEDSMVKLYQGFFPYKVCAATLCPAAAKAALKCAFEQAAVDQAITACALERYRLVNGKFPETLAELSPHFIEKIPHDIIKGEPLKYRRTDDGKFILYSVGWNETDDGGVVALSSNGQTHRVKEGDWVWQYSTNPPAAKPILPP